MSLHMNPHVYTSYPREDMIRNPLEKCNGASPVEIRDENSDCSEAPADPGINLMGEMAPARSYIEL